MRTGINNSHPEFSGRILLCHSEITNTNTCDDQNGHGTHTAGIAGAAGNLGTTNSAMAKGVAPNISFDIDQVLDTTGSGTISGVIAGIDWSTANGAKVISMSLGTSPVVTTQPNCDNSIYGFSSLRDAINNAVSQGVTVVAAAGNSGPGQGVGAPACISSTIAVGAVDNTDTIAGFSSRGGPMADHGIVAPGVNIFSTLPGGYGTLSGTSMATPMVSGTVALMIEANSSLSPTSPTSQPIRSILFNTACNQVTSPSCPTGTVPNTVYGYGRVDALRAYNAVATPAPLPSPDFSLSASPNSLTIQQGGSASSIVTITSLNGFNSAVTLSLSGNHTGITTSYSNNPVTPPSGGSTTSTLSLNVDPSTATGSYLLTINGASGSLIHPTTLTLTVTAASTQPSLNVSVSTDKGSYRKGSIVKITTTVTFSGATVFGALVGITIVDPSGTTVLTQSGNTGISGIASFTYLIPINAMSGTYTIKSTASATSYTSGSGSTTFKIR